MVIKNLEPTKSPLKELSTYIYVCISKNSLSHVSKTYLDVQETVAPVAPLLLASQAVVVGMSH